MLPLAAGIYRDGLFAMSYVQWQLEMIVASLCMSYPFKGYEILRCLVKTTRHIQIGPHNEGSF